MVSKWTLGLLLILSLAYTATHVITLQSAKWDSVTTSVGPFAPVAIPFLMGASPASLSIVQGFWGWSTINVFTLPGLAGNVSLTVSAPVGLTATLNPTVFNLPPSPAASILTVNVGLSAIPGTYLVVVTGTSGTSSHSVGVSVIVMPAALPGFEMSSTPSSLTVPTGTNGTSTITVTSVNGFTGDVGLTAAISPAGPSVSFTPTDIALVSDGTAFSIMKISTTLLTPSGNYAITIQAFNGTISDSWVVELFIGTVPQDFDLSSSPASLTIPAGNNGTSTIRVNSINGFTGDVRLTATISPTGPSASFTPTDIAISFANRSGTSVLGVVTTSSTAPGSYVIKTNGTSNSISHYAAFSLVVIPGAPPTFGIAASPSSLVLQAGSSGSSMLTLTSLNGFVGSITLSTFAVVPNQNPPSISFSPASIALLSGQTASASLIVSTTPSTTSGGYNVLVQGSSGAISETWAIEVFVNVTPPDFSLSMAPTTRSVAGGSSAKYDITLTSLNNFSGTVSLSSCQSCLSPTLSARPMMTINPTEVALGPSGTATSNLTLFTNSTTPSGTHTVVLNARSGGLYHLIAATLTVTPPPDFILTPGSTSMNFAAGSTGDDSIMTNGMNGFAGTVSFTVSSNPSTGLTGSCPSVALNSTTAVDTSKCTFDSSVAGSYSVDLTGAGGSPSLTRQVRIFVAVDKASPTITTSLSATNVTVSGSASDSATLAGTSGNAEGIVAYNLFSGGTCTGTPTVVSNVTVSSGVIPNSASRTFNSTGAFSWNAVYRGDSNNNPAASSCESFTVTAQLKEGFTISANPTSLVLVQGEHGIVRVTLESLGFSGRVNLTATVSPINDEGVRTMITLTSLVIHSNSSMRVLLLIRVDEDTPVGNYTITVTGTSGAVSRSVIVTVEVTTRSEITKNSCLMGEGCNHRVDKSDDHVTSGILAGLDFELADNSDNLNDGSPVSQLAR